MSALAVVVHNEGCYMSKRLEVALQIREAALQKLRAEGQFEELHRVGPVLSWKAPDWQQGGIHMLHRTPF